MLSKETIERIENEAKEYSSNFYKTNGALYGMPQSIIKDAHYLAALHFLKGATAEATRYEDELEAAKKENERLKGLINSVGNLNYWKAKGSMDAAIKLTALRKANNL